MRRRRGTERFGAGPEGRSDRSSARGRAAQPITSSSPSVSAYKLWPSRTLRSMGRCSLQYCSYVPAPPPRSLSSRYSCQASSQSCARPLPGEAVQPVAEIGRGFRRRRPEGVVGAIDELHGSAELCDEPDYHGYWHQRHRRPELLREQRYRAPLGALPPPWRSLRQLPLQREPRGRGPVLSRRRRLCSAAHLRGRDHLSASRSRRRGAPVFRPRGVRR